MSPENMKDFAAIFNDTAAYPFLDDVAKKLDLSIKTVRNRAGMMRRWRMQDESVPELVSRTAMRSAGHEKREIATSLTSPDEPIEELIDRASRHTERLTDWHHKRAVVEINIKTPGPFGVVGLPDQHLNNPGATLRRAFADADLIASHPNLYAVAVGDWIDNFIIGRLERARRGDVMSHDDSWRLLEHYVTILMPKLVAAISGNHLDWSKSLGGVDVLKRMFEDNGLGPIYDTDEMRVALKTPDGRAWIHKIRHKYRGHSKYNQVHGILVDMLENWQGEDVFWGGHIHTAGHLSIQKKWQGRSRTVRGVQLASYKVIDGYARQEGFRENAPFLVPMVVHDPASGNTLFFEDLHDGIRYLNHLRAEAA